MNLFVYIALCSILAIVLFPLKKLTYFYIFFSIFLSDTL